jgi:phosphate transport system substrate-binding protein
LGKVAVAGLAVAAGIGALAPAAGADVVVGVGANATSRLTAVIAEQYNTVPSWNNGDIVINVPSQVTTPEVPGVFIPRDTKYTQDYLFNVGTAGTPEHLPPNGAGAGKTALLNDATAGTGLIDFNRQSSQPSATDPATLEYYAFALDAVTWVNFSPNPVTNLTQADLIKIFTCDATTHQPFYTNWNQIPGVSYDKPIKKYQAQTGSGRQKSFEQLVLNGHPVDENCDASNLSPRLFESNASGIPAANKAGAIYFFGVAPHLAYGKAITANLRNGAVLRSVNGVAPNATTINTSPSRFVGTQYVYNNADTRSKSYARAIKFMGETSGAGGTNGYICAGKAAAIIKAWGYVSLPEGLDPVTGHTSFCRKGAAF